MFVSLFQQVRDQIDFLILLFTPIFVSIPDSNGNMTKLNNIKTLVNTILINYNGKSDNFDTKINLLFTNASLVAPVTNEKMNNFVNLLNNPTNLPTFNVTNAEKTNESDLKTQIANIIEVLTTLINNYTSDDLTTINAAINTDRIGDGRYNSLDSIYNFNHPTMYDRDLNTYINVKLVLLDILTILKNKSDSISPTFNILTNSIKSIGDIVTNTPRFETTVNSNSNNGGDNTTILLSTSNGWLSDNINAIILPVKNLDNISTFTLSLLNNIIYVTTSILNTGTICNINNIYTVPINYITNLLVYKTQIIDSQQNPILYGDVFISLPSTLSNDIYFEYNKTLYIYYISQDVKISSNTIIAPSVINSFLFNIRQIEGVSINNISGKDLFGDTRNIFTNTSGKITANEQIDFNSTNNLKNFIKFTVNYTKNTITVDKIFILSIIKYTTTVPKIDFEIPINLDTTKLGIINPFTNTLNNTGFATVMNGSADPALLTVFALYFNKLVLGSTFTPPSTLTSTDIKPFATNLLNDNCRLNRILIKVAKMLSANFVTASASDAAGYSSIITNVPLERAALDTIAKYISGTIEQAFYDFINYCSLLINSSFWVFLNIYPSIDANGNTIMINERNDALDYITAVATFYKNILILQNMDPLTSLDIKLQTLRNFVIIAQNARIKFKSGEITLFTMIQRNFVPIRLIDIVEGSLTKTGTITIPTNTVFTDGTALAAQIPLTIDDGKGNIGLKIRSFTNNLLGIQITKTGNDYFITNNSITSTVQIFGVCSIELEVINSDYDYFGVKIDFTINGTSTATTGFKYTYFSLPISDTNANNFVDLAKTDGTNNEIDLKVKSVLGTSTFTPT